MTDFVLVNTAQSGLEQALLQANPVYKNKFIYNQSDNFPTLSKQIITQSPITSVSGKTYSDTIKFDIPKYGGLKRIFIETTIKGTGAKVAVATDSSSIERLGARFYSDFNITNKTYAIQHQSDLSCETEINNADYEQFSAYKLATQPFPPLANGVDSKFLTPFFGWFNKNESLLDTESIDSLQVELRVNNRASLFPTDDATFAWSFVEVKLICMYVRLLAPDRDHILKTNFAGGDSLMIKSSDVQQELQSSITLSAGHITAGYVEFTNLQPRNVNLTYAIAYKARNLKIGGSQPIDHVSITINNNLVYDRSSRQNILLEDELSSNTSTTETFTVYFGLDKDASFKSGEVYFRDTQPTVTVKVLTTGCLAGQVITLDTVNFNHSVVEINNGQITKYLTIN